MNTSQVFPKNGFFQNEHFETFIPEKIFLNTAKILKERKKVQIKLLELHDLIFPQILQKNWEISQHNSSEHIVSGIDIDNPFIPNHVSSIWLHYGKTNSEIKAYKEITTNKKSETFINHIRLQVIIFNNSQRSLNGNYGIGTWLVIGKNNSSIWDRTYIKDEMKNNPVFLSLFHNIIVNLDNEYFIKINNEKRFCSSFSHSKGLKDFSDFVKKDDLKEYFIIGKDFQIDDELVNNYNFPNTVMNEFSMLYPLYSLLKHTLI